MEAAGKDVKHVATAIQTESLDNTPEMTLALACSALNSTEYTAGFSAHQWAFGSHYSISDEDVRLWQAGGSFQRVRQCGQGPTRC